MSAMCSTARRISDSSLAQSIVGRVNVPGVVGMGMTIAVMVPVCIAAFGMGMAHRKNPR
jgi:hypothetical protein